MEVHDIVEVNWVTLRELKVLFKEVQYIMDCMAPVTKNALKEGNEMQEIEESCRDGIQLPIQPHRDSNFSMYGPKLLH